MAERFTTKRQPEHRTEQTIEQSRAEQLTTARFTLSDMRWWNKWLKIADVP